MHLLSLVCSCMIKLKLAELQLAGLMSRTSAALASVRLRHINMTGIALISLAIPYHFSCWMMQENIDVAL